MYVSIVGTAGRGTCIHELTKEIFDIMCITAINIIENDLHLTWDNVNLVSGGAAWSDHIAVSLYMLKDAASLTLFLPCKWISKGTESKYFDDGSYDWRKNPGRTSNSYHKKFSAMIGRNSLHEIEMSFKLGAKIDTTFAGFHNRNTEVAKSDILLAFTFGKSDKPDDGGTLDTWTKCKNHKIHVQLPSLKVSGLLPSLDPPFPTSKEQSKKRDHEECTKISKYFPPAKKVKIVDDDK